MLVHVCCLLTNYPKESNVKYLTATNSISVHTRTHQVHWQTATEVFFEIDQQQQRTNRHLHKLVRTPVHTQFFVTWRNVACNWSTCARNVFWQAIHSNWLKEENEQNGNEEIKKRKKVKYDEESSLNNDEDKKMEEKNSKWKFNRNSCLRMTNKLCFYDCCWKLMYVPVDKTRERNVHTHTHTARLPLLFSISTKQF